MAARIDNRQRALRKGNTPGDFSPRMKKMLGDADAVLKSLNMSAQEGAQLIKGCDYDPLVLEYRLAELLDQKAVNANDAWCEVGKKETEKKKARNTNPPSTNIPSTIPGAKPDKPKDHSEAISHTHKEKSNDPQRHPRNTNRESAPASQPSSLPSSHPPQSSKDQTNIHHEKQRDLPVFKPKLVDGSKWASPPNLSLSSDNANNGLTSQSGWGSTTLPVEKPKKTEAPVEEKPSEDPWNAQSTADNNAPILWGPKKKLDESNLQKALDESLRLEQERIEKEERREREEREREEREREEREREERERIENERREAERIEEERKAEERRLIQEEKDRERKKIEDEIRAEYEKKEKELSAQLLKFKLEEERREAEKKQLPAVIIPKDNDDSDVEITFGAKKTAPAPQAQQTQAKANVTLPAMDTDDDGIDLPENIFSSSKTAKTDEGKSPLLPPALSPPHAENTLPPVSTSIPSSSPAPSPTPSPTPVTTTQTQQQAPSAQQYMYPNMSNPNVRSSMMMNPNQPMHFMPQHHMMNNNMYGYGAAAYGMHGHNNMNSFMGYPSMYHQQQGMQFSPPMQQFNVPPMSQYPASSSTGPNRVPSSSSPTPNPSGSPSNPVSTSPIPATSPTAVVPSTSDTPDSNKPVTSGSTVDAGTGSGNTASNPSSAQQQTQGASGQNNFYNVPLYHPMVSPFFYGASGQTQGASYDPYYPNAGDMYYPGAEGSNEGYKGSSGAVNRHASGGASASGAAQGQTQGQSQTQGQTQPQGQSQSQGVSQGYYGSGAQTSGYGYGNVMHRGGVSSSSGQQQSQQGSGMRMGSSGAQGTSGGSGAQGATVGVSGAQGSSGNVMRPMNSQQQQQQQQQNPHRVNNRSDEMNYYGNHGYPYNQQNMYYYR